MEVWRTIRYQAKCSYTWLEEVSSQSSRTDQSQVGTPTVHKQQLTILQCMLMMSDLQLLTGLAIMISGFTQLRACVSIYHWQRLTHLAWFSCVTHLTCSTFLREHLRKNKRFQLWRVPGMVALVIMLLYVLATTAQYDWTLGVAQVRWVIVRIVRLLAICIRNMRLLPM